MSISNNASRAAYDDHHVPSQAQIQRDHAGVLQHLKRHPATVLPVGSAWGYFGGMAPGLATVNGSVMAKYGIPNAKTSNA